MQSSTQYTNSKIMLFLPQTPRCSSRSDIILLISQMWLQLCQQDLKLPHWHAEICMKVAVIQLLDQTMKFLASLENWMNSESPFLPFIYFVLFRNIRTSSSSPEADTFGVYIRYTEKFWISCHFLTTFLPLVWYVYHGFFCYAKGITGGNVE